MAKSKKSKAPAKAPAEERPTFLYVILVVVAIIVIAGIFVAISDQDDALTAWATIKSRELHAFMQECRDNGGNVDVRPNTAPQIVFVCEYADRMVEYSLQPGK